jgi:hypothetical protein
VDNDERTEPVFGVKIDLISDEPKEPMLKPPMLLLRLSKVSRPPSKRL